MESLVSILESYDINESFKSQTLRDLMSVIDKDAFKAEGKYILPRGIAWDKIEEKDVFYGETGDASFYENFVSKKEFICLWYPLVKKDILKTSRRKTRYLEPGRFLITTGAYFIQSSGNIGNWRISNSTLTTEYAEKQEIQRRGYEGQKDGEPDFEYRRRTSTRIPGDQTLTRSSLVSGRDYYEIGHANASVKNIFDLSLCSIIAIPREVIAANDTSELINNRYRSKVGATALLLEPISDQDKKKIEHKSWYTPTTFKLKASDYPEIRKANLERYEEVLKKNRYKYKGLELLKKYEPIMRETIEAIDKYSKEIRTIPEYIKMISDEQFVDVYFNHVKGGNSMIADYVEKLQQNYDVVVEYIDTVIRKYKAGFKNGTWYIDNYIEAIDKAVTNLRTILDNISIYAV